VPTALVAKLRFWFRSFRRHRRGCPVRAPADVSLAAMSLYEHVAHPWVAKRKAVSCRV